MDDLGHIHQANWFLRGMGFKPPRPDLSRSADRLKAGLFRRLSGRERFPCGSLSWRRADKMAGQMRQRCFGKAACGSVRRRIVARVPSPHGTLAGGRPIPVGADCDPPSDGRAMAPFAALADRRLPRNTPAPGALHDEGDRGPLRTVCDLNESKAGSVTMTAV